MPAWCLGARAEQNRPHGVGPHSRSKILKWTAIGFFFLTRHTQTCLQLLTLIYYSFFLSNNVMFKTPVTAEYLLEAATAGFSRAVYFSMHELITSLCGFLKGCHGKLDTGWNFLLTKPKSLSSTNGFGDNPTLEIRNNYGFLSGDGVLPNRQSLHLFSWKHIIKCFPRLRTVKNNHLDCSRPE